MNENTEPSTDLAAGGAVFAVVEGAAGGPTVVVSGELDMASAPHLERFLCGHLVHHANPAHGVGGLGLDLAGVSFFSAAGLRALLGAAEAAGRAGTALRVTALSVAVEHFLALTGTRHHLVVLCPATPAAASAAD